MLRATEVISAGGWSGASDDEVVLDHDRRHRRRIRLTTSSGVQVLLDLARARHLREGDALLCENGHRIRVRAAAEPLLEIAAPDAAALVRIAWHLGNRHLPTQLLGDRIRIRADHVIAQMVEGLGGTATAVDAPFDPEGGAYAGGHHHHHHDHDDDDERGAPRAPTTLAGDHDLGS
ncbi:urease accessory protein UreE [Elioraea rosea]|uniref:urease accessory protein UreE n=1 Tax=Elioraea rosea TaxID=2492390 RepID=UPI001184094F|nr:urease accessory protein UreE [Elioraea rosea]